MSSPKVNTKSSPKVLLSIINWNQYEYTIRCIQSLKQLDYDNFEIVVVDNCSKNDSVAQIKKAIPKMKLIALKTNLGFAYGHSKAVDYAKENAFDLIWILNPDLIVHPKSLEALVQAYKVTPNGVFGSVSVDDFESRLIDFGGGHEMKDGKEVTSYNFYEKKHWRELPKQNREVSCVEGSSILIPLAVIDRCGFMDNQFFMYGEETDYCYGLRKKGVKSYMANDSIVVHYGATTFLINEELDYIRRYYRMRNYLVFSKRHKNMKNIDLLNKKGGLLAFIKFYIKWMFLSAAEKKKDFGNYIENLAIIHALIGRTGKTFNPEDYIYV